MSPALFGFTLVATIVFPAVWYVRRDILRTAAQAKVQPLRVGANSAPHGKEMEA